MVSRFAFSVFVRGVDQPVDFEQVVYTVTRIWANGLRFPGHR
jgi:hypothetical protein